MGDGKLVGSLIGRCGEGACCCWSPFERGGRLLMETSRAQGFEKLHCGWLVIGGEQEAGDSCLRCYGGYNAWAEVLNN